MPVSNPKHLFDTYKKNNSAEQLNHTLSSLQHSIFNTFGLPKPEYPPTFHISLTSIPSKIGAPNF